MSRFKEVGLRIPFGRLGAAVSPTDKLRKDGTLPPVTAKKPIVFFWDDRNCHVLQRSALISRVVRFKAGYRLKFMPLAKQIQSGILLKSPCRILGMIHAWVGAYLE